MAQAAVRMDTDIIVVIIDIVMVIVIIITNTRNQMQAVILRTSVLQTSTPLQSLWWKRNFVQNCWETATSPVPLDDFHSHNQVKQMLSLALRCHELIFHPRFE